jgi:hypothetical protein
MHASPQMRKLCTPQVQNIMRALVATFAMTIAAFAITRGLYWSFLDVANPTTFEKVIVVYLYFQEGILALLLAKYCMWPRCVIAPPIADGAAPLIADGAALPIAGDA